MPSVKTEPLVLSSLYNKSMQTLLEWTILKTKQERKKKKTMAILAQNFRQHFAFYIFFLVSE